MDIKIIDNAFEIEYQQFLYEACKKGNYNIGWNDNGLIDTLNRVYFHCVLDTEIITRFEIEEKIRGTEFGAILKDYKVKKGVINCSRPGETYYAHAHDINEIVVLYYPNLRWQQEWGGETMFYDKKTQELIYANEYKPNRLLMFDGTIPHSVRPPSYISDQYRFTMATFFIPKNN